jgi:hypothetical protein
VCARELRGYYVVRVLIKGVLNCGFTYPFFYYVITVKIHTVHLVAFSGVKHDHASVLFV